MKTLILFFALFICFTTSAQTSQIAPKTVYDTTKLGQTFTYKWTGDMTINVSDSVVYNGTTATWNHNYLSMDHSYATLTMTKIRIVAAGDTLQRQTTIRIPFSEIPALVDAIYTSLPLKKAYKRQIRQSVKLKISEE